MPGIYFKKSILLRYNLLVAICIHFVSRVWWVLTDIYTCVTTTESRYRNFHHPRKFLLTSLQSVPPSLRYLWFNFCHPRLVLPVLEPHRNGIINVLLSIWLLWCRSHFDSVFLRFSHMVGLTLFFLSARCSSWNGHTVIHLLFGFVPILAIANKASVNIYVQVVLCASFHFSGVNV